MALSWPGAFKKAVMYMVWLIFWGLIGVILVGAGTYVASTSLTNLFSAIMSGMAPVVDSSLLTGIALALAGYILFTLGSIASLIRLIYDLTRQASLDTLGEQQRAVAAPRIVAQPVAPVASPVEPRPETARPAQPIQQPRQVTVPPAAPNIQSATTQAKYCAFCGKVIPINARFCPSCQRAQP